MDFYILETAFFGFLLFLTLHILIYRSIDKIKVVNFLIFTYFLSSLLYLLIEFFIFYPQGSKVPLFVSFLIYNLMVVAYILGIFGMLVSSLRIRLLLEIGKGGKNGITVEEILKSYNKELIIGERLKRLVESGELSYEKGRYSLKRGFSVFLIHNYIFEFLRKLYG